jgi:hypothetical protein
MSFLLERVSYLRGLADGMELEQVSKEGKVLSQIIDVLDDMAQAIHELDDEVGEIDEYLELMDEDLSEVEEAVFEEDDDEIDEITCPECGEIIYTDLDELCDDPDADMEIECPNCGTVIEITDDCECGCCCDDKEDKKSE